jgi:hypothetical protein
MPELRTVDLAAKRGSEDIAGALSGDHQILRQPQHSMHSGSLALDRPHSSPSSAQGGLLSAKAREPDTYRRNLRCRGSNELEPTELTMQARLSPPSVPRDTGQTHWLDCE